MAPHWWRCSPTRRSAVAWVTLVESVVSGFFGEAGVVNALASTAGSFAEALVSGKTLSEALSAALASLETDQVMVTAVLDTIAGALDLFNELFLSNTVVQNALSTLTSTLVEELLTQIRSSSRRSARI